MTHLIEVKDSHFAWLLGQTNAVDGLRQPPGGVDAASVLQHLRRLVADLHFAGCRSHWLIVREDEVVGLCGYKRPPDASGAAEIGYGIAASRRRLGHASEGVELMLLNARIEGRVRTLVAETTQDNPASRAVLRRNGFSKAGTRQDPKHGLLLLWSRDIADAEQAPILEQVRR